MDGNLLSTEILDEMFLSGEVVTKFDNEKLQGILDGKAELSDTYLKETPDSWTFSEVPDFMQVFGLEYGNDEKWNLYVKVYESEYTLTSDGDEHATEIYFDYQILTSDIAPSASSDIDIRIDYDSEEDSEEDSETQQGEYSGTIIARKSDAPSYVLGGNEDKPLQGKLPDNFLSGVGEIKEQFEQFKEQFGTLVQRALDSEYTLKEFFQNLKDILQ